MVMLTFFHESRADTYVTTEGDTIVIVIKAEEKGRVINKSRRKRQSRRGQTCYLENRETNEKVLTTNPSKQLLRTSRVIWCSSSSMTEPDQKSEGLSGGKIKKMLKVIDSLWREASPKESSSL